MTVKKASGKIPFSETIERANYVFAKSMVKRAGICMDGTKQGILTVAGDGM